MKKNIGIWIDSKHAIVVKLLNNNCSVKVIDSNIELRERVAGETKKYGRFGNQYLTYEKNRLNRKNEQTNLYIKNLFKEIHDCNAVVLFGPSNMKNIFEKEIRKNMQLSEKLAGVHKSELLTKNQIVAWTKDFYKKETA